MPATCRHKVALNLDNMYMIRRQHLKHLVFAKDNEASMGFRYLNGLASRENLDAFLGLMDLAASAGDSAEKVFELTHRLRASKPMQLCLKRLAQHPESQAIIERRYVGG